MRRDFSGVSRERENLLRNDEASRWIRLSLTLDKASPSNCLRYSLPFKVAIRGANLLKNMTIISHYISVISRR